MSDELRAAGNAGHRHYHLVIGPFDYDDSEFSAKDRKEMLEDSGWRNVSIRIAEHPADDDEPITEEWWISCGLDESRFVPPGSDGNDFIKLGLWSDGSVNLLACEWPEECFITLPHIKTRGDVRRLCKSLGIELREDAK